MSKGTSPAYSTSKGAPAAESRFDALQQHRPATQTTRSSGGHPQRSRPYVPPGKERSDWSTPMRSGPPMHDRSASHTQQTPSGSPAPTTPQPHQPLFRGSQASQSQSQARGGAARTDGIASLARSGNSPNEGRRLSQREKQVSYGYVTDGYKNMIRLVNHDPLLQCGGILPLSPPNVQHGSKRTWDILLRKWRRALHMFDFVFIDGEDDEAHRLDVIEQQRLQWINIAFMGPAGPPTSATPTPVPETKDEGEEEKEAPAKDSAAALEATMASAESDGASSATTTAPLKPRVSRVRLSLETLMAVKHSPLVPKKLPVEDELRCILTSDACFEPVRNVVPQSASSLTRGTDISPLEAGIKIHIAPSAAVLRQQLEQQQRHQDTLHQARQQSSASAMDTAERVSESLPVTVAGSAQRVLSRPSVEGESSPPPRHPGPAGQTPLAARCWSSSTTTASPALAPPPPLPERAARVTDAGQSSPTRLTHQADVRVVPPGAVMVMMVPTILPDGRTVMVPANMYGDVASATGGAMPMLWSPYGCPGMVSPSMPQAAGLQGLYSPPSCWESGQPTQPALHTQRAPPPPPPPSSSQSAPRWSQSQSRARAEEPQTVPRFVPMLSATKGEVRLADRLAQGRAHADPNNNSNNNKGATPLQAGHQLEARTPNAAATGATRGDEEGDAQRALFTAADDDDDEARLRDTVARRVAAAATRNQSEAGEASLLKGPRRGSSDHDAAGTRHNISQDLFGQ